MKQINAEETPYAVKSVGALFCSRCLTKIPDGLIMICYGSWKYCPSCATQVFGSDTHNVMEQELEGKMQQNDINNGHELQGPFFQAKEPGKTHGTITRKILTHTNLMSFTDANAEDTSNSERKSRSNVRVDVSTNFA